MRNHVTVKYGYSQNVYKENSIEKSLRFSNDRNFFP